jgi:hypothetical protein
MEIGSCGIDEQGVTLDSVIPENLAFGGAVVDFGLQSSAESAR